MMRSSPHLQTLRAPRWAAALVFALFLALLPLPAQGPGAPVRIMPLGDSITEAEGGWSSYRHWLWNELVAAGYSVDFVGSMSGVYSGVPLWPGFDQDHEGHWGWRADEILAMVGGWALAAQPDVVLMHLGTNDIWQGQPDVGTLSELSQIVQQLRLVNANVVILAARLIPGSPPILAAGVPAFNAQLPAWAASLTTPQSPVLLVDQFTGFDPAFDTYDGVHPDESGEKKVAERWLNAVAPHLGGARLVISAEVVSGDLLLRNLAAPPGDGYFTALTFDAANAGGGLGTGWFSGLHIPLGELVAEYVTGTPPFFGVLDATGASGTRYPAAALAPLSGSVLYGVTHAIGAGGSFSAVTPPVAFLFP